MLVGGTEKLRGGDDYGVPLAAGLDEAIAEHRPELVLDLSDEPVLDPPARFRLASRVLAHGLPYEGADFRFEPPVLAPFALPSLAVVGTGKRVGKTAVTGHVARLLSRDRRVVVVAMGRGGPPEPEVVRVPPTARGAARALARAVATPPRTTSRRRRSPASRRSAAAAAAAGSPAPSGSRTCSRARALAAALEPELVLFDGSGAAIAAGRAGRRVLVVVAPGRTRRSRPAT